jgi:ubiquinone/menaquinone biosynthesis C-methylase UbiE
MALYDRIGRGYDATRRADPVIAQRLIDHLKSQRAGPCLDVACGTGNYTAALAAAGIRMCGLDHSRRMIMAARSRRERVTWLLGDVGSLPFLDSSFEGAICTLAIHHFPAMGPAFREVFRVVYPGRFILFTGTAEQMRGYWLNEYFPDAMAKAIRQMPSLDEVLRHLDAAGFRTVRTDPYEVAPDLRDLFLYSGKHRPELYLDARVRAGISTFAALAEPAEVRTGCERLARDIRSGRMDEVIDAYRREGGDYLFIIAEA